MSIGGFSLYSYPYCRAARGYNEGKPPIYGMRFQQKPHPDTRMTPPKAAESRYKKSGICPDFLSKLPRCGNFLLYAVPCAGLVCVRLHKKSAFLPVFCKTPCA